MSWKKRLAYVVVGIIVVFVALGAVGYVVLEHYLGPSGASGVIGLNMNAVVAEVTPPQIVKSYSVPNLTVKYPGNWVPLSQSLSGTGFTVQAAATLSTDPSTPGEPYVIIVPASEVFSVESQIASAMSGKTHNITGLTAIVTGNVALPQGASNISALLAKVQDEFPGASVSSATVNGVQGYEVYVYGVTYAGYHFAYAVVEFSVQDGSACFAAGLAQASSSVTQLQQAFSQAAASLRCSGQGANIQTLV